VVSQSSGRSDVAHVYLLIYAGGFVDLGRQDSVYCPATEPGTGPQPETEPASQNLTFACFLESQICTAVGKTGTNI